MLSMGLYRQSSGPRGSGPGISGEGYDGAESFFEQVKNIADGLNLPFYPGQAEQSAAAKAAVDAYMTARNGGLSPSEALFHQGQVPSDFPKVDLTVDGSSVSDLNSSSLEAPNLESAVSEFFSKVGDALGQLGGMPLGILGSLIGFFVKLFTEAIGQIASVITETARAAAAVVEDAWKKQMESSVRSGQVNLQPLDQYLQKASTQTLNHSLNSN